MCWTLVFHNSELTYWIHKTVSNHWPDGIIAGLAKRGSQAESVPSMKQTCENMVLLTACDVTGCLHHLVPVAGLTTRQLLLTTIDVIIHCTFMFHCHVVTNGLIFKWQGHWLPVIFIQNDKLPPIVIAQQWDDRFGHLHLPECGIWAMQEMFPLILTNV